jgi:hypothetical protein
MVFWAACAKVVIVFFLFFRLDLFAVLDCFGLLNPTFVCIRIDLVDLNHPHKAAFGGLASS